MDSLSCTYAHHDGLIHHGAVVGGCVAPCTPTTTTTTIAVGISLACPPARRIAMMALSLSGGGGPYFVFRNELLRTLELVDEQLAELERVIQQEVVTSRRIQNVSPIG